MGQSLSWSRAICQPCCLGANSSKSGSASYTGSPHGGTCKSSDMKPKLVYIYLLVDPLKLSIRYVGWAVDPRKRYYNHLVAPAHSTHKWHWIKSLLDVGERPEMRILELVDVAQHPNLQNEREKYWIAVFRKAGIRLTNGTDGGQGAFGYKHG